MARFFELGLRNPHDLSDEVENELRKRTWQRIAALKTAEKLGLQAGDRDIAEMIRQDEAFQRNGVFDRDQYRMLIEHQLRTDVQTFEEYLRQDLTLQRLASMIESTAWVPPAEAAERIRNLTDKFTVSYINFPIDQFEDETELDDDDIREFYSNNSDRFIVPEKVRIRFIEFEATNLVTEADFTEDDIYDYYDANIEMFRREEDSAADETDAEDSPETAAEEIAEDIPTAVPGFKPVEDVRAEIIAALQKQRALLLARDRATDFVIELTPDRAGRAPDFDTLAARFGRPVVTSELFSATETVPELADAEDALAIAFALDIDNPLSAYSDPVSGTNSVFVLSILERREAFLPELDDIIEDVTEPALEHRRREAFKQYVTGIREQLITKMRRGTGFDEAAAELQLASEKLEPFSVYDTIESENILEEILSMAIMPLYSGQLSEAVFNGDDLLLAYIVERSPGEMQITEMIAPQVHAALARFRAGLVFDKWMEWNLAQSNWQDFMSNDAWTEAE